MFERLEKYPPCVVRLLARKSHGLRALTVSEISKASGLAKSTVSWISLHTSWDRIHFENIKRFLKGCRVDLNRMAHHREFLTRRQWVHIEKGNPQQRKFFRKLLSLKGSKKG